jgi:N-acetylglucosamine-6-phosphate deacetylase
MQRDKQLKTAKPLTHVIEGIHYESRRFVRLEISGGCISTISEIKSKTSIDDAFIIAPGFIDNQVNGYWGIDFTSGNISRKDFMRVSNRIWHDGVTTFLPTIVTASHKTMISGLKKLGSFINNKELFGSVPGIHLEGPFLSPEQGFFGCHPSEYLRLPDIKVFGEYLECSGNRIIQVTIAPELEGAIDFIKYCVRKSIVIALGHTNATTFEIKEAVKNGATVSTHLGNGCANLIHRHNNPLWPQLANDTLYASIIADGQHLTGEELKVFYRAKGTEKLLLTSDVTMFIGMKPGKYEYMGSWIEKNKAGLLLNPALGCLAGASMPLSKGVEIIMKNTGCSIGDAINMASRNVASALRLDDRGSLAPGKRADILLLKHKRNKIDICQVFIAGRRIR